MMVRGCMVYTERVLRRQQFHVAPAMQQPNSVERCYSDPNTWKVQKNAVFGGTKHDMRIFGVVPFIKLQNDT